MDAAHLHLLTNHIPILLTFLSVAMLVWAVISKNSEHYKIAFIGFIIAGLAVIVVFQSGEGAEDIVEEIAGVTHDSIEAHEEAADIAWWLTVILGGGGIAGLFMNRKRVKGFKPFVWVLLVYALLTAGYLAYTGNLGGHIRHTELTTDEQQASAVIPNSRSKEDEERMYFYFEMTKENRFGIGG
ncbi:hypothetical protein LQ318_00660 [Aliifodinibius salicampi]|uniref:DUF2231 domain-containing protein n=1 Tax=Fodinibius salicampi TaxID=1920655 RepID=A0ABT3PU68_9BACT|nr:hypothetical protein [Fodinibius salicampi]MCW9711401.1 hypothetical protein [Fodinibius salicampi]